MKTKTTPSVSFLNQQDAWLYRVFWLCLAGVVLSLLLSMVSTAVDWNRKQRSEQEQSTHPRLPRPGF